MFYIKYICLSDKNQASELCISDLTEEASGTVWKYEFSAPWMVFGNALPRTDFEETRNLKESMTYEDAESSRWLCKSDALMFNILMFPVATSPEL